MTTNYFKHISGRYKFTVKEWRCCNHLWQLLLSRNQGSRNNWKPVCPDCKSIGE